jgi:hypothetical protein
MPEKEKELQNVHKIFPNFKEYINTCAYDEGESQKTKKDIEDRGYIIIASGESVFYIVHKSHYPGHYLKLHQEWMHIIP